MLWRMTSAECLQYLLDRVLEWDFDSNPRAMAGSKMRGKYMRPGKTRGKQALVAWRPHGPYLMLDEICWQVSRMGRVPVLRVIFPGGVTKME